MLILQVKKNFHNCRDADPQSPLIEKNLAVGNKRYQEEPLHISRTALFLLLTRGIATENTTCHVVAVVNAYPVRIEVGATGRVSDIVPGAVFVRPSKVTIGGAVPRVPSREFRVPSEDQTKSKADNDHLNLFHDYSPLICLWFRFLLRDPEPLNKFATASKCSQ
jgi:hypothetical protein